MTLEKLIEEIKARLQGNDSPVYWLGGPPGCGKSAIAQRIAELSDQREGLRLAASFFIPRLQGRDQILPVRISARRRHTFGKSTFGEDGSISNGGYVSRAHNAGRTRADWKLRQLRRYIQGTVQLREEHCWQDLAKFQAF